MNETYFDQFMKGLVTEDQMDDFVDEWHTSGPEETRKLSEFLGLTEAEFALFVMDPSALSRIKSSRERCNAVIHHGPGHQSSTKCERKGKHEIHYCNFGRFQQDAYWRGDRACSGFFDETPCDDETKVE